MTEDESEPHLTRAPRFHYLFVRFSPELEAQIAHMRAELLRQEQDRQRAEAQLAVEKEERERAQRKV